MGTEGAVRAKSPSSARNIHGTMNLDEDWEQDKENDMRLGRQAGQRMEGLEYQAGENKLFKMIVMLASVLPPHLKEPAHCPSLLPPQPDRIPSHPYPRME